jgi:hypothetical protein
MDEALMRKLKERAAPHGRTAEEEAREILRCALADKGDAGTETGEDLWQSIRRLVEPLGRCGPGASATQATLCRRGLISAEFPLVRFGRANYKNW